MRLVGVVLALCLTPFQFARGADTPSAPQEPALRFQRGPDTFAISGDLAEIELDGSYAFLDEEGTRKLMEITQNPIGGNEVATVVPTADEAGWFVIFEWNEIGYVKDDDSDLDADALLASIREGTKASNEERRKRGWPEVSIVGWHDPPSYDPETHNLTWAITGRAQDGESINRIVKLLGRRGVMTATLVASPDELLAADAQLRELLTGYRFQPGSTYAEFVPGKDELAKIGLSALIVGGAGAALVKTGLLARFWKLIVVGFVAVSASIKRFFRGTRAEDQPITKV